MSPHATTELLGRLDAVIFAADAKTLRITFVAGGGLAGLGFSPDDATSDALFLVKRLHPDERERFLGLLRDVACDGRQRALGHRLVSADGGERWFRTEIHAAPAEGQVLGVMIDVTDARRTAQALRDAEARLRQVVNNAPVALFAVDKNCIMTLSEGRGLRTLGLEPGDNVGRNFLEMHPPEELELLAVIRRALAGEELTTLLPSRGTWWETHWTPILDEAGRPDGFTGVGVDLTERKQAEDALARSAALMRATLEATTDGILVVDGDARIVDYNARFAEMWNIPREILEARDDERALAVAMSQLRDPQGFLAKVDELYSPDAGISHDVLEFLDGRIFERDSRPQRVGGATVGRVWGFRDVTAERRANRRATFLAAASKLLAGPLEDVTPLDVVVRMTVPWLCDWCNVLLVDDDGNTRSAAAYHHDPSKIELVRRLRPEPARRNLAVARVIATGQPDLSNDIRDEQLTGPLETITAVSLGTREQIDILRGLGIRARMVVPLHARGQVIGAIVFASASGERRYDHDDLNLAMRSGAAGQPGHRQRAALPGVEAVGGAARRVPLGRLARAAHAGDLAAARGTEARSPSVRMPPVAFLRQALASAERQTRRLGRLVDALLDVSRIQAGRWSCSASRSISRSCARGRRALRPTTRAAPAVRSPSTPRTAWSAPGTAVGSSRW